MSENNLKGIGGFWGVLFFFPYFPDSVCVQSQTTTIRGLVGLIGIACKYASDALEKESTLLCKNGLWYFESVKDR